jgi:hypothetical protein
MLRSQNVDREAREQLGGMRVMTAHLVIVYGLVLLVGSPCYGEISAVPTVIFI